MGLLQKSMLTIARLARGRIDVSYGKIRKYRERSITLPLINTLQLTYLPCLASLILAPEILERISRMAEGRVSAPVAMSGLATCIRGATGAHTKPVILRGKMMRGEMIPAQAQEGLNSRLSVDDNASV